MRRNDSNVELNFGISSNIIKDLLNKEIKQNNFKVLEEKLIENVFINSKKALVFISIDNTWSSGILIDENGCI
jgi:hypothetical protein